MDLHFTLAYVVAAFQRIVAEFGTDHIAKKADGTPGCTYAQVDKAGRLRAVCIVGQFFDNEGLLRFLAAHDEMLALPLYDGAYEPHQSGACELAEAMWTRLSDAGISFSEEAKRFMREAQSVQDGNTAFTTPYREDGSTDQRWGTALDVALARAVERAEEERDQARRDAENVLADARETAASIEAEAAKSDGAQFLASR